MPAWLSARAAGRIPKGASNGFSRAIREWGSFAMRTPVIRKRLSLPLRTTSTSRCSRERAIKGEHAVTADIMQKLIECVPNFSEGRDLDIIRQITAAIESADGVSLLDVDPGASTNRTVVTFVGSPEAAVEAAFRGIQKAAELIDMRKH